MIKVALVGVGKMGNNHLRVLMDLPNVFVTGVADKNKILLKDVNRKYKIPTFTNYKIMLEETKPHAVCVVVPTKSHFEVVTYALNLKINVLVEKPISTTQKEAIEMIRLAKEKNLILGVGHIERFNPAIIELKKQLENNVLGKIFSVHARRQSANPSRITDVNVIKDLAIHELDIMCYLINTEIEHIHSQVLCIINPNVEDVVLGLIKFKNNILGILDVNWITPTKIRELIVSGEKGMFIVNYLTQDLTFIENPAAEKVESLRNQNNIQFRVLEGNSTTFKIVKKEPLYVELETFIHTVNTKIPFVPDGNDGLNALILADQLVR